MSRMWGKPSGRSRPPVPERPPNASVRFRSGRTVTVVSPAPDELIRLWREQAVPLPHPPGSPRLLVVREQWTHRPTWPEHDVTIDLNAIEAIQVDDGTAPERQTRGGSPVPGESSNPHGLGVMPCANEEAPR